MYYLESSPSGHENKLRSNVHGICPLLKTGSEKEEGGVKERPKTRTFMSLHDDRELLARRQSK